MRADGMSDCWASAVYMKLLGCGGLQFLRPDPRFARCSASPRTARTSPCSASPCPRSAAAARSALEPNLGDGAAAFVVGADDVAVAVAASHTVADEIIDVWRTEGDPFVHAWEDRFVVDHGYRASVREVVRGLLAKTGHGPKDFAKLVLYG